MRIDVLTIFPNMFTAVLDSSILKRAQDKSLVSFQTVDFRCFSTDKHNTVDDYAYGGGGGMVLKPEPIFNAMDALYTTPKSRVILMCPQGEPYTQAKAELLSKEEHLVFICGHYEGYDERIRQEIVTDEISIGDYILTGGEIPAMVVIDSIVRLIPGVLGNRTSAVNDSFSTGLLEHPHYTRPSEFRNLKVPDVLINGHHKLIDKWRREQSLLRTLQRRPDLLRNVKLSKEDQDYIKKNLDTDKEL